MALCGGIVLEEALDLSFDRVLMMMMYYQLHAVVILSRVTIPLTLSGLKFDLNLI